MKILYVVWNQGVDYLADTVLIGLCNNGHEVVDSNHCWWLGPLTDEQRSTLYGRAFTIGNALSADREFVTRTDIEEKIRDRYFDIVIYGSVHRCLDYIDLVLQHYSRNEIIFLDGEDRHGIVSELINRGLYFKREIGALVNGILPISFSVPKAKFCTDTSVEKTKYEAYINPLDVRTYVYEKEEDYYTDYQSSVFGYTMPKGGWDCMRHYEIVANRCIPYFNLYESKPTYTMANWPSDLQAEANQLRFYDGENLFDRANSLTNEFFNYAYENLTCEAVAEKMLNRL